jgi:hypothetical protein
MGGSSGEFSVATCGAAVCFVLVSYRTGGSFRTETQDVYREPKLLELHLQETNRNYI